MFAYLVSIITYTISYLPVLIGLSNTSSFIEANPRLDELLQTHGLGAGLILAYLTSLETGGLVLALTHIAYLRPVLLVTRRDLDLARRTVTFFTGLIILFRGWTFFLDAYADMRLLVDSRVWSDGALWIIYLSCLASFIIGLLFWGVIMMNTNIETRDGSKEKSKPAD